MLKHLNDLMKHEDILQGIAYTHLLIGINDEANIGAHYTWNFFNLKTDLIWFDRLA